ncbi:MAG: hypothetical protein IPL65_21890 [Lewinellaceae bacterium]|nr:hypothetical protein [Lewinellaceae bacterium]
MKTYAQILIMLLLLLVSCQSNTGQSLAGTESDLRMLKIDSWLSHVMLSV